MTQNNQYKVPERRETVKKNTRSKEISRKGTGPKNPPVTFEKKPNK